MSDKMREAFANLCKECGPTISFYDFEMGWDAAQSAQYAELWRLRMALEKTQSLLEMLGLQSSDEYQANAAAIAKAKVEQ